MGARSHLIWCPHPLQYRDRAPVAISAHVNRCVPSQRGLQLGGGSHSAIASCEGPAACTAHSCARSLRRCAPRPALCHAVRCSVPSHATQSPTADTVASFCLVPTLDQVGAWVYNDHGETLQLFWDAPGPNPRGHSFKAPFCQAYAAYEVLRRSCLPCRAGWRNGLGPEAERQSSSMVHS